jgi:large subunit ribosomal protein L35Ae
MNGIIVNFRRARHHQKMNQLIISISKINSKEKADALIGKKVVFKTETQKEINGKITSSHGNSGCVRASFEKGIPGQALGKPIEVDDGNT